ncbi:MAG: cytochrome c oxidase subunit [Bacilli bacterium]|nr:cytochrome c oxidase subunit [Bacilli bacterium]
MYKRKAAQTVKWLAMTVFLLMTTGCERQQFLVFNPVGPVARIEVRLIYLTMILTAIVVIPVILLLWFIVYRYRDTPGNTAPYRPEWSESRLLEIIWWGIPIVIVAILGTITVQKTFQLTKPPMHPGPPLTIQVMSLDWKWLFLYPEQNIATIDYCQIPVNRTVEFVLTSNAPMNSFWVPQLGGQEYSMPGMAMRLWLEADKPGSYFGTAANFSGRGFAHMRFNVDAGSDAQFASWVQQIKSSAPVLTPSGYQNLLQQGVAQKTSYSAYPPGIFEQTVSQDGGMYMKRDKVNEMLGHEHVHAR